MKIYKVWPRNGESQKYFVDLDNAIDFVENDAKEHFFKEKGVKLRVLGVVGRDTCEDQVVVDFVKEKDGTYYVSSYINVSETED